VTPRGTRARAIEALQRPVERSRPWGPPGGTLSYKDTKMPRFRITWVAARYSRTHYPGQGGRGAPPLARHPVDYMSLFLCLGCSQFGLVAKRFEK